MDLCCIVHSKQNRGAANGNAADGQVKSEAAREPAPQPSLASQMRVGPVAGTTPGNPLGQPNRQGGTVTDSPSALAFSGSRQVTSTQQKPPKRGRPTEAPSHKWKEPKR